MNSLRDDVREDLIVLLQAARDLPEHDKELVEVFLDAQRLRQHAKTRRQHSAPSAIPLSVAVLLFLLVYPVFEIVNTIVEHNGLLPRADAGALPALYWLALIGTLLFLAATIVVQRLGRQIRLPPKAVDR